MHTTARTRFTGIALILALGLTGPLWAVGIDLKSKSGMQRQTATLKPARLWIKAARVLPRKPQPGSRMTLIVNLGYTGTTQSRPFRLILEKAGKRRKQIASYLWKQGVAPRRRASHRFSLLAPKRAGVKSCYRVSLKPMARQGLLAGPAKQLCVTTAGIVRGRQISQSMPLQTTRVGSGSGSGPCPRPNPPAFASSHAHDNTPFSNGSTVAVVGVEVGQVTPYANIPNAKEVQLRVTLNYNMILPSDAVATSGGTPQGWLGVGPYSLTSVIDVPPVTLVHTHPVIQAGNGTKTLTTSILCRPGLSATDARISARIGFWKRCGLLTTKPLLAPVSKPFDYNGICQAALGGG